MRRETCVVHNLGTARTPSLSTTQLFWIFGCTRRQTWNEEHFSNKEKPSYECIMGVRHVQN